MRHISARSLLCAIVLVCAGAWSAYAEEGFVWDGMHSRFATDFSQTADQCREEAALIAGDPFTDELGAKFCSELQRMAQAGQCDPVDYDLRGHRHHLMGLQRGGRTDAVAGAYVALPWQPDALICEFGETEDFVFVATLYIGQKPNGQPACYNVAIDYIPKEVVKMEPEAIPVTVEHVGVSHSTILPRDIPLGKCVPFMVRYIVNRRRF